MLVEDEVRVGGLSALHFASVGCKLFHFGSLVRMFDLIDADDEIFDLFFITQTHFLKFTAFLLQRSILSRDLLVLLPQLNQGRALSVLDGYSFH